MVCRQQRLFGFLIIALCSCFANSQEVKVLGLFGDRAFIKVNEKKPHKVSNITVLIL